MFAKPARRLKDNDATEHQLRQIHHLTSALGNFVWPLGTLSMSRSTSTDGTLTRFRSNSEIDVPRSLFPAQVRSNSPRSLFILLSATLHCLRGGVSGGKDNLPRYRALSTCCCCCWCLPRIPRVSARHSLTRNKCLIYLQKPRSICFRINGLVWASRRKLDERWAPSHLTEGCQSSLPVKR